MNPPTINELSHWIGFGLIENCFKHDVPYDDIKETAKRYADMDFVQKIETSLQKKKKADIYIRKLLGDLEKVLNDNPNFVKLRDAEQPVSFLGDKMVQIGNQKLKIKQYKLLQAYYVLSHPCEGIRIPAGKENSAVTEEIVEDFKNCWQDSVLNEKAVFILDVIKTIT